MKKNKGMPIRNINRLLIVAVIIISIAVILFSAVSIENTDNLEQYVEATYNNAYTMTINAMDVKSYLYKSRETMFDVVESTHSDRTAAELEQLYKKREELSISLDRIDEWMKNTGQGGLRSSIRALIAKNDQSIGLSFDGRQEEGALLLEQNEPIYEELDAILDNLIAKGTEEIESYVAQSHDLNMQTNRTVLILGIIVIALCLMTSIFSARFISSRNDEIYQRETLFNIIMENVDDVFIIYDYETGDIEFSSQNAERMLGLAIKPQVTNNYSLLKEYVSEDVYEQISHAYDNGEMKKTLELEYGFIHAQTGERKLVRTRMYPYYDKNQKGYRLVSVTQDITQDRQAQEALLDALNDAEHANAVKRDFLSRVSHDLKTPINAIVGMKAIAEMSVGDEEKTRDCLEKIDIAARHLLDLVNDVLDISRLEAGNMKLERKPFDLGKMIDDITSIIYSRATEQELHFNVVREDMMQPNLIGDETSIRQIVLNFLTNAVKFTGKGGNITFFIRQHDLSEDTVFTRFTVRDDGIGIAADFIEKIFVPFEQEGKPPVSRFRGAGLGLAISKSLASQLGGDITVISEEGEGSEFSFDIKMGIQAAELERHERRSKEMDEFDFSGKRILIVEDNDINMEISDALLTTVGFEAEQAVNGKEAVILFEEKPEHYYDIILMDVHMPVMDGLEATRAIRASSKGDAGTVPVVAMTANASHESINESISSGMNAHIAKPIDPKEVLSILEELLAKKGGKDE
ncbi:response regulator [Christensenellaceae bacterium OttesenSCG-928-K19]|nr:response regulator [Christensenellaceae bacterium OttesenSCG-928-K19]